MFSTHPDATRRSSRFSPLLRSTRIDVRLVLLLFVAALSSLMLGCSADPRTEWNAAAEKEFKARNYSEAEKYAAAAVKESVQSKQERAQAISLFQLGEIYIAQQRYAEAEENLQRSLEIFQRTEKPPPFGRYWTTANLHRLGFLYETLGRYTEA